MSTMLTELDSPELGDADRTKIIITIRSNLLNNQVIEFNLRKSLKLYQLFLLSEQEH